MGSGARRRGGSTAATVSLVTGGSPPCIAMIEGLVTRMRAEIGRPAKVIATGGLAVLFKRHTDVFDVIEPDLTIQGLAMMWERAQAG